MAVIEISQASVPAAASGSRYDLLPREVIVCEAISPAPGPGVIYLWEIEDAAGSTATLDSTSNTVVNIGAAATIHPYCAFKLKLIADDNGAFTESTIAIGVPHALGLMASWGSPNASRYIVPEMFSETADPTDTIAANTPADSTDNFSRELADTGITAANWRGWSTKDYDAKKRLLDQTFVQGWEMELNRVSMDVPTEFDLFDIRLLDMHQYFPVEMWGMAPTFEIVVVGATSEGFPVNLKARIQYNVLRAYYADNGGPPGATPDGVYLTYEEYDCPLPGSGIDAPETVLTPNAPTGPTHFYEGDGTEPDGIYLLPYLHQLAADDWSIALKFVFPSVAAEPSNEDLMNLKVRVRPLMAAPDTVGYVDPDFT